LTRNVHKQHEELESNKIANETNLIYFLLEWSTPTAGFHKDFSTVLCEGEHATPTIAW